MESVVPREAGARRRARLNRERVLKAAVKRADREGIDSLSMRRLGQALGVEAMSLYNHVRDKEDILDGIVEAVVADIDVASEGSDWKSILRHRVMEARRQMLRHRWAARVIESRAAPGPAMTRYMDGVIGILREGGFSLDLAHHAMHLLGSRVLGFNQDLFDDSPDPGAEITAMLRGEFSERYPYAAEMALAVSHEGGLGGCDDDVEFAFGLDLILDGLDKLKKET